MESTVPPAYIGVWINRDYGTIKGATLTIPTANASYLVAFLALFIQITGGHLWGIISYILFQYKSTLEPRDGRHHQHQAIFRNYHTSDSALGKFLKSAWFWREKKRLPAGLPLALLALLHFIAFAIASILSARVNLVTDNESEVLVAGPTCGFWESLALFSNLVQDFTTASTMAKICSNKSSDGQGCNSYAPEQIRWSMTQDVSCPFASNMCIDNKAVRFDSGLISSHTHLGINAPQKDRFSLRRVIECAPITRDGFMVGWHNMSGAVLTIPDIPNPTMPTKKDEMFLEFFYGPNYIVGLNSTFIFSNATPSIDMWSNQKFSLQGCASLLGFPEAGDFTPIPEVNRTDADVNLLFLGQNSVRYSRPVDDPWFQAHEPRTGSIKIGFDGRENDTWYIPKYPISVVGCACQYQICTNRAACTPLTGMYASFREARDVLSLNPKQKAGLRRMVQVLHSIGDISQLASTLTGNALLANQFGTIEEYPLPNDPWIQELNHIFGTLMRVMQIRNYRYVGGYDVRFTPNVTPPAKNERWMCSNQIVRRSDYQSVSVLGIAIILGIGSFITLVNLTLSKVVAKFQKYYLKHEHAYLEWDILETETLQRMAYRASGVEMLSGLKSIQPVLDSASVTFLRKSP